MPEDSYQEKTEKPTLRKLQKARKEGSIAKSPEVPSVLILLTSLGVFLFGGSWMFWSLSEFMGGVLHNSGTLQLDGASLHSFVAEVLGQIFSILMPLMLAVLIAGVAGNVIQIGLLITSKPFGPKISKLNPIKGMKRILSLKSIVEVIKAILKICFIGGIAFLLFRKEMNNFPTLMGMSVIDILAFIGSVSFKICFYVCLALIILAVLDFGYQRWQYEKDQRMTKQEVKEELKQSEGDPKVKGRIKQIQLETARRRMMGKVPEADVVVTNPTSLAIALKYDPEKMMAPGVLAKGAGFVAEKIKMIAKENGVPVVENKPFAQALFKTVEIGDLVPVNLYKAAAEILAYVYNLKKM
ncbi:MAG: flagellar biosynthesis protein FlhB [Deltaproteobacteria bacterium]|nr:flagellar biosynthesis protein FlhB [Deltaproteobacteria bacterium]